MWLNEWETYVLETALSRVKERLPAKHFLAFRMCSQQQKAPAEVARALGRRLKEGAPLRELRTEAASALAITDIGDFTGWNGIQRKGARTAASPEGACLAICAYGIVTINDRGTGESVALVPMPGKIVDLALPRGPALLAVLEENRKLSLWNVKESRAVWTETVAGAFHMPRFPATVNGRPFVRMRVSWRGEAAAATPLFSCRVRRSSGTW